MMTLVLVDIGNSQTRFASLPRTAESSTIAEKPTRETAIRFGELLGAIRNAGNAYVHVPTSAIDADRLNAVCQQLTAGAASWIVGSVQSHARKQMEEWHRAGGFSGPLRFLTRADFPFDVRVREPDRVGIDRMSAAYAASLLKPTGFSAIVVDAGTAVTVDAISGDGAFLGGTILPGFELAGRALAQGTSQLPQLPSPIVPQTDSLIGVDTEQAITNGVFWGCVGAVSWIVERMRGELQSESVAFLTGGAAASIAPFVPFEFELQPDLVMIGMALAAA